MVSPQSTKGTPSFLPGQQPAQATLGLPRVQLSPLGSSLWPPLIITLCLIRADLFSEYRIMKFKVFSKKIWAQMSVNRQKLGNRGHGVGGRSFGGSKEGEPASSGVTGSCFHPNGGYMGACKCENPPSTYSRSAFLYIQVTLWSLKETSALGIQPHPQVGCLPQPDTFLRWHWFFIFGPGAQPWALPR